MMVASSLYRAHWHFEKQSMARNSRFAGVKTFNCDVSCDVRFEPDPANTSTISASTAEKQSNMTERTISHLAKSNDDKGNSRFRAALFATDRCEFDNTLVLRLPMNVPLRFAISIIGATFWLRHR